MGRMVLLCCLLGAASSAVAAADHREPATVLVVYYSDKGHTKAMAEAVAKGAGGVEGAAVRLLSVSEATADDVLAADAVIVGSPVHKANVAPPVQEFINSWPVKDERLHDKLGAAFATGSGVSAGEELVQLSILQSMLVCRMIVAGGPGADQPFGASAVGETPLPADGKEDAVAAYYLKKGEALGKRIAELSVRLKISKKDPA